MGKTGVLSMQVASCVKDQACVAVCMQEAGIALLHCGSVVFMNFASNKKLSRCSISVYAAFMHLWFQHGTTSVACQMGSSRCNGMLVRQASMSKGVQIV